MTRIDPEIQAAIDLVKEQGPDTPAGQAALIQLGAGALSDIRRIADALEGGDRATLQARVVTIVNEALARRQL